MPCARSAASRTRGCRSTRSASASARSSSAVRPKSRTWWRGARSRPATPSCRPRRCSSRAAATGAPASATSSRRSASRRRSSTPTSAPSAAVHRGVQRVRPLDGRPHRAAARRRARPRRPPAHAHSTRTGACSALSPDLLSLARAEALQEDGGDARRGAGGAALDHQRPDAATSPACAERRTTRRSPTSSWPTACSAPARRSSCAPPGTTPTRRARSSGAHLFLYLAVDAAYTGRSDTVERLRSYEPLIDRLIEQGPPVPQPRDASL